MNIWKLTTVGLAVALGLLVSGKGVATAEAEDQPAMEKALGALNLAEKVLDDAATHDKGGHRVKALRLTRDAIKETKKGIEYDNKHKKDDKKDDKKD